MELFLGIIIVLYFIWAIVLAYTIVMYCRYRREFKRGHTFLDYNFIEFFFETGEVGYAISVFNMYMLVLTASISLFFLGSLVADLFLTAKN
jgi:hypothetical protein